MIYTHQGYSYSWTLAKPESEYFQAFDLIIEPAPQTNGFHHDPNTTITRSQHALTTLQAVAERRFETGVKQVAIKLVAPTVSGYVVRSDFLSRRLVGCSAVEEIRSFVAPKDFIRVAQSTKATLDFHAILEQAVGAIVLTASTVESQQAALQSLNYEFRQRLSYPWLAARQLENDRLVIVGHRHPAVMSGYLAAAFAMGVRVTLVDAEDGFLPIEMRHGAVAECIAIDMRTDDGLANRIVSALRSTGVTYHGITTWTDTWLVHVARAAAMLNLITVSVETVQTCLDKHATRLLCQKSSQPIRISDLDELKTHMAQRKTPFEYPLVVKPCTAWGSLGVHRVDNEQELFSVISEAKSNAKNTQGASKVGDLVIDSYIDGPEIDANFVLQDGEILFFEMVDGFPCSAEVPRPDGTKGGDFLETDQVWPTGHPQNELEIVRNELHRAIMQTEFRNGVFHVEARIKNSAMKYQFDQEGILDLRPQQDVKFTTEPSAFLLEINQRPPGHGGSTGTALSSGIDFNAIYMMSQLGERERVRALSHPFTNGAVQTVCAVFINTEHAGVFKGPDVCQDLGTRRMDLTDHVQYSNCYYDPGEEVTDSPARVALFVVASKEGRRKVLELSRDIREAVAVNVKKI